jgi:hypothetical protein
MSSSKISIALAATALLVSVLFATPLGQAAGRFVLAKNSVGSKQVINGSLTRADLSKKTIAALHGVPGPRGAQGIQGAQGTPGIQGVQGVAGTARAYGRVAGNGTLTRSKNIASVGHPATGVYCLVPAAGIDPAQTGLIATPDYTADSTVIGGTNGHQAIVEWRSQAPACAAGQMQVITGFRSVSTTGSSDGDVRTVNNDVADQGFFFVIP